MAAKKLTQSVVKALEPRLSDYVEWCGMLAGFGCRVRPTGSKSFIAQYRVGGRNSPTRKVTVGTYGKLTVEEAREAARAILAKAELGHDVAGDRAKQRAEMTVAQLCDEYLVDGCGHKKLSTIATDKGRIERHIKPLLGRKRVSEVKRADVEKFMRDVEKGKTAVDEKTGKYGRAIVTGGKGTATRTVRLLGGIFTYAVDRGYIETNPRLGVKVYADGKGERFLSGDELGKLGEAMREAEIDGLPWQLNEDAKAKHRPTNADSQRDMISPHAIAAIRLLLLTGCRAGEILNLKWQEVDFERGFLNLSDSKTGRKQVLISPPALQILADIPRIKGNSYVIAGEKPDKPRSDIKRPWKRITAHAGLDDLRLHDLRHSYASVGASAGMGLTIVGKLLGHASPATTARYSHFADDPLRLASNSISETISAAIGQNSKADNVVAIKSK
ncbi:tyrosine-type recombinase/integrase [Sphingomonas sp. CFBP 8764]|uniref:tyrosine-type recombinase/integrase n=1 Tax=Sphingomonas sp. CFBP 8764 TaxID=2775275 RepID=UPI00177C0303|nr:site-specific integrase [Sphingomonas sp. CFBP 8764]MBD8550684.1 tyrosine-type recombinase/integrase [Sphingomonas sp. CFBP 8764]